MLWVRNVNGMYNFTCTYSIVSRQYVRPSVSGLRKLWCREIVDLMERMWAQEHQDRPTMSEVVRELEELVSKYP